MSNDRKDLKGKYDNMLINDSKEIEFGGRTFGNKGAMILANGLLHYKSLERLLLLGCEVREEGVKMLCRALEHHKKIRLINFGPYGGKKYNYLARKGTLAIAGLLKITETLESLTLSCCSIEESAVNELVEAANTNESLKALKLGGNLEIVKNKEKYHFRAGIEISWQD